jgi:starch synthase
MNNYFAIDEIKSVAYVSPEAGPFAKTGGLGDVAGELPQALALLGIKTYIFTIGYNSILEKYNLDDTGLIVNVPIDFREVPVKILSKQEQNVTYYFLVAQPYTDAPYQGDKLHLTILLSEGTLKAIEVLVNQNLMLNPQVIHVNDWQTGLIPVFIKTKYDKHTLFSKTATVLTVHNQGHRADWIPGSRFPELGIDGEHWFGLVQRDNPNYFCILRGAIFHADKMNAVSKTNRDELLTDQYGGILANDFRERNDDIVGIMNGVDYEVWKPVKIEDKSREKSHLQSSLGFDVNPEVPLIGMVARIDNQKNVKMVINELIRNLLIEGEKIQFVFLGKGDENDPYNDETLILMDELVSDQRWSKNVKFIHRYTTEEQKKVFAGIDLFLYPSKYEPCGTKPIVALINGVPCVVRKTGGLADNFTEYDKNTGEGNGFVFEANDKEEFRMAMKRAIELFKDKGNWQKIVKNAQNQDRSWKYPAMEYVELYKQAFQKKASYTGFVKPFGHSNKFIRYGDLEGTFDNDLECKLDLIANIFSPVGRNASSLAGRLNGSLGFLQKLNFASGGFSKDLQKRLNQKSCANTIVIKVSNNLSNDAVSYYTDSQAEIIFSNSFIDVVLGFPQCAANIILAIRLFHELGHTSYTSFYAYLKEEDELIKDDVKLYRIISGNYPNEVSSFYPRSYEGIMKGFTDDLIADFNDVVNAIEDMEAQAREVYNNPCKNDINDPDVLTARRERIQRAFSVADPDFPGSILSRLKAQPSFKGTFLENYLTILGHRGIACGRESFFFLEKGNQISVIPFEQLKNPRVGNVEDKRWARQYYALHYGLYMSDGLATTEAENGRGYRQKYHEHVSLEKTISLCENTIFEYASNPRELSNDVKTITIEIEGRKKEFVDEGGDKGKEVITADNTEGQTKKYVVDKIYSEKVPFAGMISMSAHTFHTLENRNELVPSIDFTTKEPITQLIKNFVPDTDPKSSGGKPCLIEGKCCCKTWGKIYTHSYGLYNSHISNDENTGEMAYILKGEPKPVMYDKLNLNIKIVVVDPGQQTEEFNFSSLYNEMQPIRIFPWSANIPKDDKVETDINPDKHKWVLDRDHTKIKATFTVVKDNNISYKVCVNGGDIILLNNDDVQPNKIKSFKVKNNSKDNFELMFFILKVENRDGDPPPEETTLTIKGILM